MIEPGRVPAPRELLLDDLGRERLEPVSLMTLIPEKDRRLPGSTALRLDAGCFFAPSHCYSQPRRPVGDLSHRLPRERGYAEASCLSPYPSTFGVLTRSRSRLPMTRRQRSRKTDRIYGAIDETAGAPVEVFGSGFLVSPDGVVMTAKHNIAPFLDPSKFENVQVSIRMYNLQEEVVLPFPGLYTVRVSDTHDAGTLWLLARVRRPSAAGVCRFVNCHRTRSPITIAGFEYVSEMDGVSINRWERIVRSAAIAEKRGYLEYFDYWRTEYAFPASLSGGASSSPGSRSCGSSPYCRRVDRQNFVRPHRRRSQLGRHRRGAQRRAIPRGRTRHACTPCPL